MAEGQPQPSTVRPEGAVIKPPVHAGLLHEIRYLNGIEEQVNFCVRVVLQVFNGIQAERPNPLRLRKDFGFLGN